MVTLPPSGITGSTPPALPPATAQPATVAVPAQIVAAEGLVEALKNNVLLPVLAIETQMPEGQSGLQLLLKTPQGQVQITLPQALLATLTTPQAQAQLQQTLSTLKTAQLQILPFSAATNTPNALPSAQLVVPTQEWQQILKPLQALIGKSIMATGTAPLTVPLRLPALQLPPEIAAAYGAPLPETPEQPTTNIPRAATNPTPQQVTLILQPATAATTQVATSSLPPLLAAQNQATAAPTANNVPVPATVVANTPPQQGQPGNLLLRTDDGRTFMLPEPTLQGVALKVGDHLAITVASDTAQTAPTTATVDARHPALAETLTTLTNAAPALAQQLDAQLVMKPGQPMQGTLLFLMSAIGNFSAAAALSASGKPRATEIIDALTRAADGKLTSALAARLLGEFQTLLGSGVHTVDQQGHTWHTAPLPTMMQPGMTAPFTFYIQQRQDESGHKNNDAAAPTGGQRTRFVVDLHLSQLGHTQLEGLSRSRAAGTHGQLDLALRTETPLPEPVQNDLMARYTDILSASGLTGALTFSRSNFLSFRSTTSLSSI